MAVIETLPELATRIAPSVRHASNTTHRNSRPWLCWLFLACWCGLLFFQGLNIGQLWKTEGLRAIIAAEFLRTGNWIVPTLYGEPLFTKPPGMYAAIALCSLPFGEVTAFTARLPSALAATLTVLMLYWYFGRVFGRAGGLLIAVLAPMSPLWLDKSTAAEIDMLQVMWVTGSILCLLRALEAESEACEAKGTAHAQQSSVLSLRVSAPGVRRLGSAPHVAHPTLDAPCAAPPVPVFWWLAALLFVAGGVLTKWTAPAFFYATAIPLLWLRGQMRLLWSWRHLTAAAVGASICLAWIAAAVAMEGWSVFFDTVKREAFQRMVPEYAPTPDPWYVSVLHPPRLWLINLPWSLVALVACWPRFGRLWDRRGRLVWQTLHCWIWPNILIWSLILDHKPRHSFPLFPAIAGLAAMVWLAWLDGRLPWKWRVQPRRIFVGAMVCWLVVKIAFVNVIVPHQRLHRDPQGKAAILAALVPHNCILYLFKLKDEGIMFYYGGIVRRLSNPSELPSPPEPLYCILAQAEWERWRETSNRPAEALTDSGLTDEQGAKMVLIRVH